MIIFKKTVKIGLKFEFFQWTQLHLFVFAPNQMLVYYLLSCFDGLSRMFFLAIAPNGHDLTVDFPKQLNWTGLISEMELVPCSHEGTTCSGCNVSPIKGTRFKCKVCDSFDYCENCFYTKRNHRHSFSRIIETGRVKFGVWKVVSIAVCVRCCRNVCREARQVL